MKLIRRRRKNRLCTGILISCFLCFCFLLSQDCHQSFVAQFIHSYDASSFVRVPVTRGAINRSKPLIGFHKTVQPVLDDSGYFVGKVAGGVIKQANHLEHNASLEQVFRNNEIGVYRKEAGQSILPKSSEDLVDILDSKISQIPQGADVVPALTDDLNLADDFLQIHQAFRPAPKKANPVRVIIVTNRRSGSSFLGQMINQNPNVFFNFEPLKVLEKRPGVYANQSVFLNLLLSCNFKKMPFLMEFYNKERLHRSGSLALTSPPLCTLSVPVNSTNVRECEKLHPSFGASVCTRYSHTAAKLIRLGNISSIEDLVSRHNLNLKIIHLVRDPRGILSSRSRAEKRSLAVDKSLDGEVGYLCRRMKYNVLLARSNLPWLENRYKLVRYEDIAYNPENWVKEIYQFAGLGAVPSEVLSWIRTNTKKYSQGTYATSRDSKVNAEAWRKDLSLPVAHRIGEVCKDLLKLLKYQQVEDEEGLRNITQSLVQPL